MIDDQSSSEDEGPKLASFGQANIDQFFDLELYLDLPKSKEKKVGRSSTARNPSRTMNAFERYKKSEDEDLQKDTIDRAMQREYD